MLKIAIVSLCSAYVGTSFAQDAKNVNWPEVKKIWDTLTPSEQASYQVMLLEARDANKPKVTPPPATILGQKVNATNRKTAGNNCAAATYEISTLPFAASSTTVGNTDDYQLLADCGGATADPYDGDDLAYRVRVDVDCDLSVNITNEDYDAAVYVLTDCAAQTCVAGGDDPEDAAFTATAGTDYFVIADGWNSQEGAYDLSITETTATGCELLPVELQSFSID